MSKTLLFYTLVHLSNMLGWQVHCKPGRAGGGHHVSLQVSPRHAWPPVREREPGSVRCFRFLVICLRCTPPELTGRIGRQVGLSLVATEGEKNTQRKKRRHVQNELVRQLDMVLPKDFRRGMSVNGAGGRSLGITGRSLHDVLEDTVMAVAQLQGREAKSVKPHADSKRRKVGFVPPAASPTPPMPTILQNE